MSPASVKHVDSSSLLPDQTCQRFTLAQVRLMTHNFDERLVVGRGGFGKVYKCPGKTGPATDVAIKRLHPMSNQGAREFRAEVEMLSKLRHCNLVSLIGYCDEEQEMILVYEFMPNGTLEDHLHKANTGLSWLQRLKLCIGAGRGLDYLHTGTGTRYGVIHRDIKSSNILLDANFAAKISDFGLAKIGPTNQTRTYVSTGVKGTFGYMDPCYFVTGKLTRKTDVYAFGVVLFEVLCGRQAVDLTLEDEECGLAAWAQDQIKKGKLDKIIDSRLTGQILKRCLKEFAWVASKCLHNQPKKRPTMFEVLVKLESILMLQEREIIRLVDQATFITKVRLFFSAKADLTSAFPVGSDPEIISGIIEKSSYQNLRIFTYSEMKIAANNFKHEDYSTTELVTVYKGWVNERTYMPTRTGVGLPIYVRMKRIGTTKVDHLRLEEFNHPNLIKPLGYCLHDQELFCVYELPPNASLDKHLFGEADTIPLSWVARLKIAMGAAQGLSFLHRRNHVAYRQFKTSVILLDTDFNTRLSDFEVENSFLVEDSYLFNNDAFYAAPEWFSYQVAKLDGFGGSVSQPNDDYFGVKSEIYAFGVVLLEILTGKKVYDVNRPQGKQNLVKWATPLLADESNLGTIMDPELQHGNHHPPKGALTLALLVSNCLQPIPEKRPSMEDILQVLYHCYDDETKSV